MLAQKNIGLNADVKIKKEYKQFQDHSIEAKRFEKNKQLESNKIFKIVSYTFSKLGYVIGQFQYP